MTFLRSLLTVLLLATVLAPTLARADEEVAAGAELRIEMFGRLCPPLLAKGFVEMEVNGDGLAEGLATDACACIDARLRAIPAADVADVMGGRSGSDFEQISNACVSLAMKPRVGALCRAFVGKDASIDAAEAEKACTCAQQRSDALGDDAFITALDGKNGGLEVLLAECEPGA